MVVPVVQHDRAQHHDPRLAEHHLPSRHQTPAGLRRRFSHVREEFLRRPNALFVRGPNLVHVLRLWRVKIALRGVKLVPLQKFCDSTRNIRDVKASWPSDIDFGCGLQESLSPGTLSRIRLVMAASSRISFTVGSSVFVMIASPEFKIDFCSLPILSDLYMVCAVAGDSPAAFDLARRAALTLPSTPPWLRFRPLAGGSPATTQTDPGYPRFLSAPAIFESGSNPSPYLSWWRTQAMVWGKASSSRPLGVRSSRLYVPTRMSSPRA